MATRAKTKFSDEEKAAYLQAQREKAQEQFESAVAALQSDADHGPVPRSNTGRCRQRLA
jgi:hypothetical protein